MKLRNQTLLLILCTFSLLAETPEELADLVKRQCRSIHLGFESGPADGFYNEVRVTQSSVGTYYCVAGFSSGYFGLQEREGDKVIIFFRLGSRTTKRSKLCGSGAASQINV